MDAVHEGGEVGGCERCGVGWGRTAGELCHQGPHPAEEREDAQYGAECIAQVAELFSYGNHSCDGVSPSRARQYPCADLPKNEECVAIYVLSSICAKPPNAPTMLSMI